MNALRGQTRPNKQNNWQADTKMADIRQACNVALLLQLRESNNSAGGPFAKWKYKKLWMQQKGYSR
jgi:hypothetical protein